MSSGRFNDRAPAFRGGCLAALIIEIALSVAVFVVWALVHGK
jgi:hypothetical protein